MNTPLSPVPGSPKTLSDTTGRSSHDRYCRDGREFIDDELLEGLLLRHRNPETARVRDIIERSLSLQRLEPDEAAVLLNVTDPEVWEEIFAAAGEVKRRVYGPRVVTFAPLYCSNYCVNSCVYCGFRRENREQLRRILTRDEIRAETTALVESGHKRLVVVYGEHPCSGIDYMVDSIETVYDTKVGAGEIRRVNVNAAPLDFPELTRLHEAGIGTFQVFQETYHHDTYRRVHPRGPKSDYRWRLYALHRAQEVGIDDVAIGALFGLYDWRFEVLGLLCHAIDFEEHFDGIGPHTISFPRIEPAAGSLIDSGNNRYAVGDRDFKRLIAVLRLAVPYTGLIVTARERAGIRREALTIGCTQTDASSRIGIGAYAGIESRQQADHQQFMLGDTRGLDEVVRELAEMGLMTSFCTSGYRCGRTGRRFMEIAKAGDTKKFCLPNAILTMKEYLLDYAGPETRQVGESLLVSELDKLPAAMRDTVAGALQRMEEGQRDIRV